MGQYYHPVILDPSGRVVATMYSHEYGEGLKLMEHSYLGNPFVEAFEILLAMDAACRVVWAGDYADDEPVAPELVRTPGTDLELREAHDEFEGLNLYGYAQKAPHVRMNVPAYREQQPWHRDPKPEPNFEPPFLVTAESHPFILNHDDMLYVDKRSVPDVAWRDGLKIHPLPLLTCEGNGRGGGDYFAHDDVDHLIGSWARKRISVGSSVTDDFTEIKFNLTEPS
ncbi:hypothetical protein [Rhodococcus sp. 11-3]|uniref:hypothetical protein n=1 Tax=Rhodococcus sp. 11-3 TaxID=2854796 RepID=UPI0020413948|nr:hypothetical protein [Rhodococcus sp. 11-3]USC17059.1 hypothetical protein KZJ41_09405 [Rhodococcus sp. 11-3]